MEILDEVESALHSHVRTGKGGGTARRLVARIVPHFRLGELISPPCTGRYEVLSLALGCQAYRKMEAITSAAPLQKTWLG